MATAALRNLDPPMYHAPFPAGFPLTRDSPRILAEDTLTDRAASQRLRKELAEQEPRYETGVAPYPSGTENLCAYFLFILGNCLIEYCDARGS